MSEILRPGEGIEGGEGVTASCFHGEILRFGVRKFRTLREDSLARSAIVEGWVRISLQRRTAAKTSPVRVFLFGFWSTARHGISGLDDRRGKAQASAASASAASVARV